MPLGALEPIITVVSILGRWFAAKQAAQGAGFEHFGPRPPMSHAFVVGHQGREQPAAVTSAVGVPPQPVTASLPRSVIGVARIAGPPRPRPAPTPALWHGGDLRRRRCFNHSLLQQTRDATVTDRPNFQRVDCGAAVVADLATGICHGRLTVGRNAQTADATRCLALSSACHMVRACGVVQRLLRQPGHAAKSASVPAAP